MSTQQLITVIQEITRKDNWLSKIYDPQITNKWRQECQKQGIEKHIINRALSRLRFVLDDDELGEILSSKEFEEVESNEVEGVFTSLNLIPLSLKLKLISELEVLESVPEKDWHPGSNQQVLDLIHPSLYCYVLGVSILKDTGRPEEAVIKEKIATHWFEKRPISLEETRYQWLPAEFSIKLSRGRGEEMSQQQIREYDPADEGLQFITSIDSEINNLSRSDHSDLYHSIASVFSQFCKNLFSQMNWFQEIFGNDEFEFDDEMMNFQVIVKAANIHLTPENPKYPGGSWHLEGMPYENIIATGIYYYQLDNLTPSYLEFRQEIEEPDDYPQEDEKYVIRNYGLKDGSIMNEHLGQIKAIEGKCVVFPNTYQHRVKPFELLDPSRPGDRKILVFFLVDPEKRILSTRDVFSSSLRMIQDELNQAFHGVFPANSPIIEQIAYHLPQYIDLKSAKSYRESLMRVRKYYIDEQNAEIFEREFSLCEH